MGDEGVCARPLPEGGDCSGGAPCEEEPSHLCIEGTCQPLASEGEPCTDVRPCDFSLHCIEGTCVAPHVGMACEDDSDCGRELRCLDGACAARLGEGDTCERSTECEHGTTCWGDPPVCTSNDGRDAGDYCLSSTWWVGDTCWEDLVCRIEAGAGMFRHGTCVVGQQAGDPCDAASPCGRQLRCVDGACHHLAAPGQPCGPGTTCPYAHYCDETCQPLPAPGQACTREVGCLKGLCIDGVCCLAPEGTSCGPPPADSPLGICETDCPSDDLCGLPAECDPACAGSSCWPTADRCVPRCAL